MKEHDDLALHLKQLHEQLAETEQTLAAIRGGEVDALVLHRPTGFEVLPLGDPEPSCRPLLEAMGQGAAIIESAGLVMYCNGRLSEMVNMPPSRVIGCSLHAFVPEAHRQALATLLRDDVPGELEIELSSQSGRAVPVLMSVVPEKGASQRRYVVVTDLTEQRRSAEVALAAQHLASANAELEELGRRKDEFLAVLAGEINDTLSQITTSLQRIRGLVGSAGDGEEEVEASLFMEAPGRIPGPSPPHQWPE